MSISLREAICRAQNLPDNEAIIRGRAVLLDQADRELVEAVLIHNQPAAVIARMTGQDPRWLRKRVRQLGARLGSDSFLRAARAMRYLPKEDAELARCWYCQGLTQRQLTRRMGMSSHILRRRLDQVRAEIDTIDRMAN